MHVLVSQLRALQATEDAKQAWVSEDLCVYDGMCPGEKDHREQKAFHTHYSYLSGPWKAKKSQVEGMTALDPVKREACAVTVYLADCHTTTQLQTEGAREQAQACYPAFPQFCEEIGLTWGTGDGENTLEIMKLKPLFPQ